MKPKLRKYWLIITLVVLANIAVFTFFSKGLESFVSSYTIEEIEERNGL